MERRRVALTFDVDLVDWVSGQRTDELTDIVPELLRVLDACGDIRATFFVRLDDGIARRFGRADHAFAHAGALWDRVRAAGHEVAWHHHAVLATSREELPEFDEARLLEGLQAHAVLARQYGCQTVRMGWGQHTNASMAWLADDGWLADSSAMPRPCYEWDPPLRDWSRSPLHAYRPAREDRQSLGTGSSALSMWEVPMTLLPIPVATDTQRDVRRYLNPAYHAAHFSRAVSKLSAEQPVVLLCHPYECVGGRSHLLYAFTMDAVRSNLSYLASGEAEWLPMVELVRELGRSNTEAIHAHAA